MKVSLGVWGKRTLIGMAALCVCVSCSVEETIEVLGNRSQAPVFLGCRAASGQTLQFRFSQPVEVLSFIANPPLPVESVENGEVVQVNLSAGIPGGEPYTADILVKDEGGNTLNVLIPFRSRNERLPRLLINELRTEYSKPKTEYVELKTLEAGDLGALRLFIPGNTKTPMVFEFPPAEVAAHQYIVIHLRTVEDGVVNETGGDPSLSGGADTAVNSWDFWIPNSEKLLHKTDVVYLMDQDDNIIDAVMMSENPDPWWTKDHFVEAADLLYRQEAWASADGEIPGPADAVVTFNIKTAMTRSISRDETVPDSNGAADWYITATSGATPGTVNNAKRFEE
ncbi:MAG: lamin tail domain-containing protein [Treponema sp.]|nr:lamin tail domain-containing protein [Treponema sp.]